MVLLPHCEAASARYCSSERTIGRGGMTPCRASNEIVNSVWGRLIASICAARGSRRDSGLGHCDMIEWKRLRSSRPSDMEVRIRFVATPRRSLAMPHRDGWESQNGNRLSSRHLVMYIHRLDRDRATMQITRSPNAGKIFEYNTTDRRVVFL